MDKSKPNENLEVSTAPDLLDFAVEQSFPASDPIAVTCIKRRLDLG